jgi:hypothetical protein
MSALRRFKRHLATALLISVALMAPAPTQAQDAPFGCKVLLCALARNPSWGGIPYCVPVMTVALQLLRKGRGFLLCPQAQASYGHEPYQPCGAGFTPAARSGGPGDEVCARPKPVQQACASGGDSACGFPQTHEIRERVPRAEPYFVETRGENGQIDRSYFSLR